VEKDELLGTLQCEFINRINEVGVDVNRALAHPCAQSMLQYICGLGSRKGSHLLKVLHARRHPAAMPTAVTTSDTATSPINTLMRKWQ